MPANRPHLKRDEKVGQIVDAAEALLLRDGYDSTTMAAIAGAAGVSTNAVYWYFPSKDDVLAAVQSRRQQRAFARLDEISDSSLADRARVALAELDAGAELTAAVHERAKHSAAVAGVHEDFHRAVGERLTAAFLADGLNPADAGMAAAAIVAIVEGLHLHEAPYDPARRDELVVWALRRFAAGGSAD